MEEIVFKTVESARKCNQCCEREGECPNHVPIREMIAGDLGFHESVARYGGA